MRTDIIYSIVVKSSDGGMNMDSFLKRDSAINRSKEIINHISKSSKKGIQVYLSELKYDYSKNRILSESLINNDSELLFEN